MPISQRIKQATLWQSIERYHSSFLWLPLESSTTVCENHSIADLAERYVNIHSHLLLAIIHRDLSINQLSGTIPSSMLSLVNLQSLCVSTMQPRNYTPSLLVYSQHLFSYIHTNQLSGTIPSSIGSLVNLQSLYVGIFGAFLLHRVCVISLQLITSPCRRLYGNQLSGAIPSSVGSLLSLQELYVNQRINGIRSLVLERHPSVKSMMLIV